MTGPQPCQIRLVLHLPVAPMDPGSARSLVVVTKTLPPALELLAAGHHVTYEFPQMGSVLCDFAEGKRRCRIPCSRLAIAKTCYKHQKAEKIILECKGKRSADWLNVAVECAKRPRTICTSYSTMSKIYA